MINSIGNSNEGSRAPSVRQFRSQSARVSQQPDAYYDDRITGVDPSNAVQETGNQQDGRAPGLVSMADQRKQAQSLPRSGGRALQSPASGTTIPTVPYDPQDLNRDGSITDLEKLNYVLKLYEARQEAESTHTVVYA